MVFPNDFVVAFKILRWLPRRFVEFPLNLVLQAFLLVLSAVQDILEKPFFNDLISVVVSLEDAAPYVLGFGYVDSLLTRKARSDTVWA